MKRIMFLTVVALVAFAGVAYGAGKITGSSIKDNTLTGKDVKDKSLTTADLSDGAKKALKGKTGAAGPQGAPGASGAKGDKGDTGDKGEKGDKGDKGEPGLSGLEADGPYPGVPGLDLGDMTDQGDNSDALWANDGSRQTSWVQCPPGKVALGGGFDLAADAGDAAAKAVAVAVSQPTQIKNGAVVYEPIEGDEAGSFRPNGWLIQGFNAGTAPVVVRPWVTCATVR